MKKRSRGLEMAIEAAKPDGQAVGTISELARRLGIRQSAVSMWRDVPSHQIIPIEKATGVSRRLLRPDLYDDETGLTGLVQPRRDDG